jgi:protein-S-isoprenylcysteine O-methyltransferase Ste14
MALDAGILPVFWQDAAMTLLLLIQFVLCPIVLVSLLWTTAPYGRHNRPGWGPCLPARMAWFVMELPALLLLPALVLASASRTVPAVWIPMLLWVFHYGYRTVVFPWLMRGSSRTFPALLVGFAITFNLLNGFNNGSALVANGTDNATVTTVHFASGALIFVVGFVLHFQADRTIRLLRNPDESDYRIPNGGLFRWVGSPQYLGEIIQWVGWALMTWSLAGLAFALFTICNLLPRAISNDRWYRQQFADYPAERKILIPKVY